VTDNAFDDRNPVWSPDGSLLAFVRARSTSTASGIWDGSRNTGADVFVLPVGSLDNINEAAIKQVTSLGFVDFDWPWLGWQPRP
jgi:Tol biopolymer transport system component